MARRRVLAGALLHGGGRPTVVSAYRAAVAGGVPALSHELQSMSVRTPVNSSNCPGGRV